MGYIKYQIEEKEVNLGDGNWYYTGEKRISDTIVSRYLDSGSCENEGETCYKLINRYNDGRTHAIRYDGYAFNSGISISEFYPQGDVFKISGMTSSVIGDCVTSLNDITIIPYATSLTSLTIGNNVLYIGNNFFKHSYSLTNLSLPTKLVAIGESAFEDCSSLTSVSIPDSVISIGEESFRYCSGITSCTIGSSVIRIGNRAFNNCTSLTSVTVNALTPPVLGIYVFGNTNDCPIYVPEESLDAYKAASEWSDYASRIQPIPNS